MPTSQLDPVPLPESWRRADKADRAPLVVHGVLSFAGGLMVTACGVCGGWSEEQPEPTLHELVAESTHALERLRAHLAGAHHELRPNVRLLETP